jgi:hypothetical protein
MNVDNTASRTHKQKRRKDSILVSVLVPLATLEAIDKARASQVKYSRQAALNQSEWIRRAIARDLDHRRRSNRRKHEAQQPQAPAPEAPAPPPGEGPGLPAAVPDGAVAA